MQAFGAYLQELRQAQGITLKTISEALGVSDRIVSAWEKAEHEPRVGVVPALLELLHGTWDDAVQLLRADMTEDEARQLARRRLAEPPALTEEQRQYFANLTPEQKELVFRLVEEFRQGRS